MMFVCNLLRKAYGTDAYKGYAVNAAWCEKSSGSYVSWKLRPCDDPGFGWINGYNKRSWWMKLLQLLLRCWLGYIKPWHRLLAVWGAISNRGTGRANGSAQPLVLSRGLRLDRFWEELVVKFIQPLNPKTFEFYLTNSMFCLIVWGKKPRWQMMTLYDIDLVWYTCTMTSEIGSWAVTLDEAPIRSVFWGEWNSRTSGAVKKVSRTSPWISLSFGILWSHDIILKKRGIGWITILFDM